MASPRQKPATQDKSEGRRGDSHSQERVLDRLADPTPSRLGVQGAMRARDVSRPTADDLAEAESTVTIRHARPIDG